MSKGYNYNTHHRVSSKELLKRFSFDPRNGRFCLAHLFTYQQFEGGVLGLAYTAPPANEMRHKEGGMCAAGIFSKNDGRNVYLNTGD
jgi:disintegrin and metalloproteinase domain-containing protein 17